MKKKKVLTVLLSVIMAASILGGCGERQETMGSAEGTRQEGNEESKENQKPKTVTLLTKRLPGDGPAYEYEYDAADNMTKELWCFSSGGNVILREYEYDAAGNMTKEISYWAGSTEGNKSIAEVKEYITITLE